MAKFCGTCGYKMEDDDRVCGQCGTPAIELEDMDYTPPTQAAPVDTSYQPVSGAGKGLKIPSKFIKAGVAALVVLIVLIAILTSRSNIVKLNDYVEFTFSGHDGYGYATVTFDEVAFLEDYGEKIEFVETGTVIDSLTGYVPAAESMRLSCVSGNLDKNSGLSNGDEITYYWTCNDKLAESAYDVKLKYEDITVKVEDLEEVTTIDLFANISLVYSGVNGYSYVDVISEGTEDYLDDVVFTPNAYEGFSNGDEITVTASVTRYTSTDINEYFAEEFGVVPATLEKTYTVSGLAAPETLDPFQYVEISFSGISSAGSASVKVIADSEYMYDVEAYLDKTEGLTNGDKVTVSLEAPYWANAADLNEYWAWNYGLAAESLEKTVTVEGLPRYVETLSDIPEDTITRMQNQAEDVLNAHIAEKWENTEELKKIEYLGSYLMTPKEGNFETNYQNIVRMAFAVEVSINDPDNNIVENLTYYYQTSFYDLILNGDGSCAVDLSHYYTPEVKYSPNSSYAYYGYESLEDLFRDSVTKHIENYQYESNIN